MVTVVSGTLYFPFESHTASYGYGQSANSESAPSLGALRVTQLPVPYKVGSSESVDGRSTGLRCFPCEPA